MVPLYSMYGGQPQMPNNPMTNMQNLMNQFQQFKQNFSGDPKAMVSQLINSGRMTPQQFSQIKDMATQFQQMFGHH